MPACAVDVSTHVFSNCGFPDTGQKICYNKDGTQIVCPAHAVALAQDGSYMPSAAQPSYTQHKVNGVLVTVDNRTGLMWVTNPTDAGMGGTYTWEDALSGCEGQTYAGYPDWRLPNVRELATIIDYSQPPPTINAVYLPGTATAVPAYYWTSTTYAQDSLSAWVVNFTVAQVYYDDKANGNYVRCVRDGP